MEDGSSRNRLRIEQIDPPWSPRVEETPEIKAWRITNRYDLCGTERNFPVGEIASLPVSELFLNGLEVQRSAYWPS